MDGWTCVDLLEGLQLFLGCSGSHTTIRWLDWIGLDWIGLVQDLSHSLSCSCCQIPSKPSPSSSLSFWLRFGSLWCLQYVESNRISLSLSASCPRVSVLTCTSVGRATGNDTPPADQLLPHSSCCDMTVYELPLENEQ